LKRKAFPKLVIVVSLVAALAIVAPMMSGCLGKPAVAPPAAPPEVAPEVAPPEVAPPVAPAEVVEPIRWRLQTYAGPALAEHVCFNAIREFNEAAEGRMVIDMYSADQLVPHGELFRAMQEGTIEAVVSDDDSMASPADIRVFAAYFPLGIRYSLDNAAMFNWWGLDEIWTEAYDEIEGVTWLSSGSWDPCNFTTTRPIRSIEDFQGLRVYMFPTGGVFMSQYGVVPVSLPYEDAEMAVLTGMLDGMSWCAITENYTVGWADVTDYYLTNNISGAWIGSWFVNTDAWEALPADLQALYLLMCDKSHYYRLHWYWWGEPYYRKYETKYLEFTTIPADEWAIVEADAIVFWDEEIATISPRCARVVEIYKEYNQCMLDAGPPYRY